MVYEEVIPAAQHRAINKKARKTNHIERFNNTLRQRVSRLVRSALSFSKKLANHIGSFNTSSVTYPNWNGSRRATVKGGVSRLNEALSWFKKVPLEAGYVVVLETAGGAGNWNPHLHILMTSGGVTRQDRWRALTYFPYDELHQRWPYHLLTMLKARVPTPEMKRQSAALWQQYPDGLVAYLEDGKVPAGGQGLADELPKSGCRHPDSASKPCLRLSRHTAPQQRGVCQTYRDHSVLERSSVDGNIGAAVASCRSSLCPHEPWG